MTAGGSRSSRLRCRRGAERCMRGSQRCSRCGPASSAAILATCFDLLTRQVVVRLRQGELPHLRRDRLRLYGLCGGGWRRQWLRGVVAPDVEDEAEVVSGLLGVAMAAHAATHVERRHRRAIRILE